MIFPARKDATLGKQAVYGKVLTLIASTLLLTACSGSLPNNLGVADGRFNACPDKPNCVNSQASDDEHRIAPLPLPKGDALATLKKVIEAQPRTAIVSQSDNYLHVTFTSALMRFVDDVEFFVTPQHIEVRSASRLGHSDLGVNRERVETLRNALLAE